MNLVQSLMPLLFKLIIKIMAYTLSPLRFNFFFFSTLQQFESEIYSRQQILHAIISDGQKMMKAGEVEDKDEFEQKLKLLAEQWQSVLRRANERKAIIESLISQWEQFNSMSQQLMRWLKDKETAMKAFEFDSTSLQSVRSLVEKVKVFQLCSLIQYFPFNKML